VDGRRLAYHRSGAGAPLVLLHGGWSDGRLWTLQLASLSDHFDVVALDLPGCGGSDDPPGLVPLDWYADAVADLVTGLDLGPAHLAGLSFGGGRGIPTGDGSPPLPLILDTFRFLAHQDRNWDWRRFNIDTDPELARKNAGVIDAINPDLSPFKQRGAKLLMYHGWADPLIAPESSINYHASVLQKMGADQGSWLRLFMVPGMGHCNGGTGATSTDWVTTLERWREQGEAPDAIRASGSSAAGASMTRPLCPHPQRATYKGRGDVNKAESFVCK